MRGVNEFPILEPEVECPVCGHPAVYVAEATEKVDLPPIRPGVPSFTTSIPGPSYRVFWPCGHREAL